MRIVFMGTPGFAVPVLKLLVLNDYQIAAVYTQPDKPAGRGCNMSFSPVKQSALSLGLKIVQPDSLKKEETLDELAVLKPDVVVVAAFGQILTKSVLDLPKYGCINIHPSLLPKYRGAVPVAASILNGDSFAGVSIMLMDKGLDTGPILAQAQIPVLDYDNTGILTDKLSLVGAFVLLEILSDWSKGRITPRPQDNAAASYFSTVNRDSGEIDWSQTAEIIWRKLRAYYPWPGCFTHWQGKNIKIIEALPQPAVKGIVSGQVAVLPDGSAGVGTGNGILKIVKLQMEGKKPMSSIEFLRGQRQFAGSVLPS
ncbi:MAG: methionyl-tRNA formyltransferase [Dehalococcoidales bacterium]|nr:methionyl-tRNA formyltransferase [Dehalococcoidales bacterium]